MTDRQLWIMVSGPYTSGTKDPQVRAANLRAMNAVAHEVWKRGHVPVIGVNMALPVIDAAGADQFDAVMMPLSMALAERCDACLRVGGPSKGADEEMALIRAKGGQVFTRIEDVPIIVNPAEVSR